VKNDLGKMRNTTVVTCLDILPYPAMDEYYYEILQAGQLIS
jgi:hypothetical protein